jgi:hypothetical protein
MAAVKCSQCNYLSSCNEDVNLNAGSMCGRYSVSVDKDSVCVDSDELCISYDDK